MAERITRESWELIAENLIDIVESLNDHYDTFLHEKAIEEMRTYLEGEGIIEVMKEYRYGMRLRGFSPGCQPMDGFVERIEDVIGTYYDILVYDRKLTEKEMNHYSLNYLGE